MRFDSIPSDPPNVLLIGCGAVGSVIARHLCMSEAVGDVVLADLDGVLAKQTAARLQSRKAHALQLDATDSVALGQAMHGGGIVVNAALPRFNKPIQEAALAERLNYVDLANDSIDPFADTERWREAGLTALCGMGEDPGISNVFARHAADALDRVDSIKVRDGDSASSPDYPFIALFSPETFIEETLAPSRIWRDGKYDAVPPFGAFEMYEFPPPLGSMPVYSVDHEEVDTLPRFIGKGVRYVDFKLALDDATVQALKRFRDLHFLDRGPAEGPSPRRALLAALPKPADLAGRVDGYAAILVEAAGESDGERVVHKIYAILGHREASERFGATATAYFTGTGAAVGTLLIADGTIHARGKLSPEHLNPKSVLPLLNRFGLAVKEEVRREPEIA